ncbi:hypothetical protein F1640_18330 [Novosphingobium sp. NBM11]|uniref:hypothetical protein n=1 Tax=Novosphingobium sp. NBM11 TaxID=2596914 RepID=UPI00189274F5|nr:hypothetical protein [Novosphingobium sp. NBM11]MBF5091913.1 hypothetical protein [Novosphingobium sp. NBM11]
MTPPFHARLGESALAIFSALDIFMGAIWKGALYPFGLADKPTGREFISTICGKAAANGHRWGRLASAAIDWAAVRLGDAAHHCQRMYEKYDGIDN